ncbi:1,4-Dihydroxy-2-naphthoyl-CoA synthase [compost metagenome]|uniref:Enoyl-CoA hydratase n=1 Tax=Pseudomonas jinjuensis TaxID=198616 RepID=A0A1H0D3A0_9PSED|nr:enoyl-CoA hydratase [Pseudomonas jinjuensis]SDN64654.1 enoyl-CoA hydratase [Pseudomonas jinjuensis]
MKKYQRHDEPRWITYEVPAAHVARISLNKPEKRNAQDTHLLYELNDAFDRACADKEIKVIILAANGPDFSAGHQFGEENPAGAMDEWQTVGTWCGFGCAGAEAQMSREKEIYIGLSERWRNIPKPTIAQVQGKCISGGLMLAWPCDLIIAADNARFMDNTVSMGISGAEFFVHPWEMGVRQAKEFLFTSGWMDAHEAWRLGMVNKVVPLENLAAATLALAQNIAQKPAFALKLAKEAVNGVQDAAGRVSGMNTAFALHQICHNHNLLQYGTLADPAFLATAKGHVKKPVTETEPSDEAKG